MVAMANEIILVHEGNGRVVRVPLTDSCIQNPIRVEAFKSAYAMAVLDSQIGLLEGVHTHISEMMKYATVLGLEDSVRDLGSSIMSAGLDTYLQKPNPDMGIAAAYAREYRLYVVPQ
jgi:hypothetical protein